MTDKQLLEQALEALEYHQSQTRPVHQTQEAITALRTAIEQAEKQDQIRGITQEAHQKIHDLEDEIRRKVYDIPPAAQPAPVQEPIKWTNKMSIDVPDQELYTIPPNVATPLAAITQEELQDLKRSEHEGWRYADELEQERKRLTAQRQWVGLSDFNIDELENEYMKSAQTAHQFLRAIEAKLKEKNSD